MEFKSVIETRYSCRKYLEKDVELDLIKKCINMARLAPSSCNAQPWKFYIVSDDKLKKQLVKLTQSFTKNASFIVVEENKPNLQQRIVNRIKNQEFSQIDIGIACSYICLQASELGLATCMIGYFNEAKIKDILKVSEKSRIRLVISIGYGDQIAKKVVKRKSIDEIMEVF